MKKLMAPLALGLVLAACARGEATGEATWGDRGSAAREEASPWPTDASRGGLPPAGSTPPPGGATPPEPADTQSPAPVLPPVSSVTPTVFTCVSKPNAFANGTTYSVPITADVVTIFEQPLYLSELWATYERTTATTFISASARSGLYTKRAVVGLGQDVRVTTVDVVPPPPAGQCTSPYGCVAQDYGVEVRCRVD